MIFRKKESKKEEQILTQKDLYESELKHYSFLLKEELYDYDLNKIDTTTRISLIKTFSKLIRNEYVWNFAFNSFGKLNNGNSPIEVNTEIMSYTSTNMDLHNKLFLVNAWRPDKYYVDDIINYKLDFEHFNNYKYYYYKNLQIGYVGSGGNHRLLLQMIQNNHVFATVNIIDDSVLLEDYYTDGEYLINSANGSKLEIRDYRLALLFTLTKKKIELEKQN